jgi:hypothetical protein
MKANERRALVLARLDELLGGRRVRPEASDIGAPWCDDAISHQNRSAMRSEAEGGE